jgi:hypothetical protein
MIFVQNFQISQKGHISTLLVSMESLSENHHNGYEFRDFCVNLEYIYSMVRRIVLVNDSWLRE